MTEPRAFVNPPSIGFDGSRLSIGERTGTETYSAQILSHLAPLTQGETLRVYLRTLDVPPEIAGLPSVEPVPIPFPRFWTHARLSWEIARHPPDTLFVPSHVVPLIHPRTVVTLHDLGYLHTPDDHPAARRRMLDVSTRWSARAATHIIAISESTRRDLIGAYGVAPAKISVIHHGVGREFRPHSPGEIADLKARLALPDRFVLTVGTVQPRKNLPRLAAAMRNVAAAGLPHRLVVAGKPGWLVERVEREIEATGCSHLMHRLGFVSSADLPALYASADAFAFPSLYEGFGLPVLEAMATGVPVLISNRAALPEVAGSAALAVDPTDVDAIGSGLVRLLTERPLRERLSDLGTERAREFTWSRAAAQTMAVLRRTAAGS